MVEFRGTVPGEGLLRWELAWSPGEAEQWQLLVTSDKPVDKGLLARLDLTQLPPGLYDFRLRVVRVDTNYTDYIVRGLQLVGQLSVLEPTWSGKCMQNNKGAYLAIVLCCILIGIDIHPLVAY